MTNSSPEKVQWDKEPLLPSTSNTVVFLGMSLNNSAPQGTCLKKQLTLKTIST